MGLPNPRVPNSFPIHQKVDFDLDREIQAIDSKKNGVLVHL